PAEVPELDEHRAPALQRRLTPPAAVDPRQLRREQRCDDVVYGRAHAAPIWGLRVDAAKGAPGAACWPERGREAKRGSRGSGTRAREHAGRRRASVPIWVSRVKTAKDAPSVACASTRAREDAGRRRAGTPRSADGADHLQLNQPVELDGVLHRQLLGDRL